MKFLILSLFFVTIFSNNISQKLSIDLYVESLCSCSRRTIIKSFKQAHFTKDFYKIANVDIYEYGNTEEVKNGSLYNYKCQHGKEECIGNLIFSCAKHYYDNFNYISFLICVLEEENHNNFYKVSEKCARKLNLNFKQVGTCSVNSEGNALLHEIGLKTGRVNYVPWVVVNGKHCEKNNNQIQDNLLKFACENYKGDVKIDACCSGNNNRILFENKVINYFNTWRNRKKID